MLFPVVHHLIVRLVLGLAKMTGAPEHAAVASAALYHTHRFFRFHPGASAIIVAVVAVFAVVLLILHHLRFYKKTITGIIMHSIGDIASILLLRRIISLVNW